MTEEQLQYLIAKGEHTPEEMCAIGESYLHGDVLRDPVAAQAWLMQAAESGENCAAVRAMELLARELWQVDEVLPGADWEAIRRDAQNAKGERAEYLHALLALKKDDVAE